MNTIVQLGERFEKHLAAEIIEKHLVAECCMQHETAKVNALGSTRVHASIWPLFYQNCGWSHKQPASHLRRQYIQTSSHWLDRQRRGLSIAAEMQMSTTFSTAYSRPSLYMSAVNGAHST